MSNGINGSLERWQWERKVEEGDVEKGADVQLGCSSGIYIGTWGNDGKCMGG